MRGDISIYKGRDQLFTVIAAVASGTTASINAGEPTTPAGASGSVTGTVALSADASPTVVGTATNVHFAGLAKSDSNETSSVAGNVTLWSPMPGILYAATAKDTTAVNTAAKIIALLNKRVVLDLTATKWTVDTAASDSTSNGVIIFGGDIQSGQVYFAISTNVTIQSTTTGT